MREPFATGRRHSPSLAASIRGARNDHHGEAASLTAAPNGKWWLGVAAERWPDARALTVRGELPSPKRSTVDREDLLHS